MMTNYIYETVGMEELSFKSKTDLRLPRYQRTSKKWDGKAKFGLSMSIFFDLPAGYICWKDDGKQKVLIDGRQRREAIREMLDPLNFSTMVIKAIPKEVMDEHGAKTNDIDKRIFHFAREWLKNYNEEGFAQYYSDTTKYPKINDLQDECEARSIAWVSTDSRVQLEGKLAQYDMTTGIGLDKKYMDRLLPIFELIRSVQKATTTALSGFNETYRMHGSASKLASWGLDETLGPRAGINEPEFFDYDDVKAKWIFNPNKFSNDLVNFFRMNGWSLADCRDVSKLVTYFSRYDSIHIHGDMSKLQKWFGDAKRKNDHDHLVEKFFDVRNSVQKTRLGVCELTPDCSITEAMKVFQLINSSGVQLSEIEVMASWPDWGSAWIYSSTTPAPLDLVHSVKKLYEETKEMKGINFDEISKWDIAATLSARLNHQTIWGG